MPYPPSLARPLNSSGSPPRTRASSDDWQHICGLVTRLQGSGSWSARLALAALTSAWLIVTMAMAIAARDSDRYHAWMLLGFGLITSSQGQHSAASFVRGDGPSVAP